MTNVLMELMQYLGARKKLWLAPILFFFLLIGGLLVLAESSALGPYIYALF